jgi:enoyl-CoA hydratase/carnithine racemase
MGLAWKVVGRDELMDEARHLAGRLLQAAPLAARATKEVAARGRSLPWVEAVRFGETMRRVAAATNDATEGWTAAREGRPPNWQGR